MAWTDPFTTKSATRCQQSKYVLWRIDAYRAPLLHWSIYFSATAIYDV